MRKARYSYRRYFARCARKASTPWFHVLRISPIGRTASNNYRISSDPHTLSNIPSRFAPNSLTAGCSLHTASIT